VLLVFVFGLVAEGAAAATLTVTTTTDETTSGDGSCSLREAIAAVNSPGSAGDCGTADASSNTIALGASTYTLSASGQLSVTGAASLTVTGASEAGTVIDGGGHGRVLSVGSTSTVTLSQLTITGGHAADGTAGVLGNMACSIPNSGGGSTGNGGGMSNAGVLTLTSVEVTGNHAGNGGAGAGSQGSGGCTGGAGGAGASGGGIYNTSQLTLTDSVITANAAGNGGAGGLGSPNSGTGGAGGAGGSGGGIYNSGGPSYDPAVSVTVTDSTISSNSAGDGGAGGDAGSSLGSGQGGTGGAGGRGQENGGGIANDDGALTVTGTTISGNTAGNGGDGGSAGIFGGAAGAAGDGSWGGGVSVIGGSLSLINTTLWGNAAGNGGNGGSGANGTGVVLPSNGGNGGPGGNGGAVRVTSAAATPVALQVTVAHNAAGSGGGGGGGGQSGGLPGSAGSAGLGGGLYVEGPPSLTLQNSLVAANAGANCNPAANITDGQHNLSFGDATCPGTNGDPKLGTLQDNAGPTQTAGLGSGSAAIDAVPATGAGCPATDQRGVARPQGAACDIGAYELAPPAATTGAASGVNTSAETLSGAVSANQSSASVRFEYGTTAAYGSQAGAQSVSGITPSPVSVQLTGLTPDTTYHYRVDATSVDGTSLGGDQTFTTAPLPPTVVLTSPSAITQTAATLHGAVTPNGPAVSACHFDYGATSAYGSQAACSPMPRGGSSSVVVSAQLSKLAPGRTYHYRLIATGPGGTSQTGDRTFNTLRAPILSRLRVKPMRFHAATRGGSVSSNPRRKRNAKPTGTTIGYRDSSDAVSTFTVAHKVSGVRVGKRCLAQHGKRPKRAKRCTRLVSNGSFRHVDRAGVNQFQFTGRVAGHQLRAGIYTLTAIAGQANTKSRPVSVTFTILP
jgi:CSLREA domain-containing protein